MYGFTLSTPLDRCYRFAAEIEVTSRDEGAAVYQFTNRGPCYVGVIVRGALLKP